MRKQIEDTLNRVGRWKDLNYKDCGWGHKITCDMDGYTLVGYQEAPEVRHPLLYIRAYVTMRALDPTFDSEEITKVKRHIRRKMARFWIKKGRQLYKEQHESK